MVSIKIDDKNVRRMLAGLERQIPFVISRALNDVAFQAMREGQAYLRARLDRPTRFTIKSWYVRRKADKRNLQAVVGWSDYLSQKRIGEGGEYAGAEYYMVQHWTGGGRRHKAFERQLIRKGLMRPDQYAVPGQAASELGMIDSHGNMKGSVIVAILSRVGALDELGYTSNATTRQSRRIGAAKRSSRGVYWAGKPGPNTPPGIWMLDEKHGGGRGRLRPVIVFVKAPRYGRRLDLDGLTRQVERRHMPAAIHKAVEHALRTAR